MAIDKNKTRELIESIDELFEVTTSGLPASTRRFMKQKIMGAAFEEINRLINDSRPPVLMLIGRSGHGKSSVLNALANKRVAEIGDVKPTTPHSDRYEIAFTERFATWAVIDTRGIFETTSPEGALAGDAVELLQEDIRRHRPDIIMHVITITEIRALTNDLRVFRTLLDTTRRATGVMLPTLVVLNKADTLGRPGAWPPEEHPKKAGLIVEALEYMADDVLRVAKVTPLDANFRLKGYAADDPVYRAIIPVCAYRDEEVDLTWNIDTLSSFIGDQLPREALLDFFQAQERKAQLRHLSSALIKRFATIASGVGASPIPIADMAILTPLQMLMIAIIGGLSCREFSRETALEFFSAAGVNVAAGYGLRYVAQQLVKMIPVVGWAGSGAVAGAGTYAIGKSAEAYFFSNIRPHPAAFAGEWTSEEEGT